MLTHSSCIHFAFHAAPKLTFPLGKPSCDFILAKCFSAKCTPSFPSEGSLTKSHLLAVTLLWWIWHGDSHTHQLPHLSLLLGSSHRCTHQQTATDFQSLPQQKLTSPHCSKSCLMFWTLWPQLNLMGVRSFNCVLLFSRFLVTTFEK